ncbi:MAG: ATP-binding protein [Bacilli bacterium]|nr:ATP-binding protein [Bacilli bacterium]
MAKETLSEKKLINEMLQDEFVRDFINEHKITKEQFNRNLETFLAYYIKSLKCVGCKGLSECKQTRHGLMPILDKNEIYIDLQFVECVYQEEANKNKNEHLHLYNTSFSDIQGEVFVNKERSDVLTFVKRFLDSYLENPHQQGLYLSGSYGCGKSYIMGNLALSLTKLGVDVAFVYYPDFVRMIKSMITTGGISRIVDELKRVPVLFLDDFGGESNSNFIRDEVLLPILQYRMVNKKPLFVTSNLSDKEIIAHLAESNKEVDGIKALRVFERLRSLMVFKELSDKNYR